MQLIYDPDTDVLRIVLSKTRVERCDCDKPGVELNYGDDGGLVGFSIKDASRRIDNPKSVDYAVSGQNVRGMRMF